MCGIRWVAAEHAYSRAKLRTAQGDHMFARENLTMAFCCQIEEVLPDVRSNDLAMVRIGVSENVLNEVIAILIARN